MEGLRTKVGDRRRDRRVLLPGWARVVSRGSGSGIEGRLVDVGAGGARLELPPDRLLLAGEAVDVELAVGDPREPARMPVVHLRGTGNVVRILSSLGGPCEAAIRFHRPLALRDHFAQLLLF
jgi:hypothetical protein